MGEDLLIAWNATLQAVPANCPQWLRWYLSQLPPSCDELDELRELVALIVRELQLPLLKIIDTSQAKSE